jgi:F0F1-type ATP synthase epsilon subunit
MQRVVRQAVAQAVPPEARRVVAQQALENATYSPQDIQASIREAQELMQQAEVQANPRLMQKLQSSIEKSREMYWESMIPGQGRRSRV